MKTITNDQVAEMARKNGIDPASLLAVKLVETGGKSGFLTSGKPQILFEGHIFYKLLSQNRKDLNLNELMAKNKDIIYPKWTKAYYSTGEGEWKRLERARKIDEDIANQSASWGMFQIMGFNYKACGCSNIKDFVNKMTNSADQQLQLGINFMKSQGMIDFLNKHSWANFAAKYNGPSYKANSYDTKLKTAYNKYALTYK